MLEQQRRQGASLFITIIFGLLILSFVLYLAPSKNQGGLEGGCGTSNNNAISVDGNGAGQTSYLVAYSANGASGRQKVYLALDLLIRRELLAQAAAERGILATPEMYEQDIIRSQRGWFFLGGQRIDRTRDFFEEKDGDLFYNHRRFQAWVNMLNVSETSYKQDQARGLQAALMGELIEGSARVSREEALADYLYTHNTVTYDVVAFDPARYRAALRLTDADIKRFLDGHTAEVEARYKVDERTYKGTKPQLALREIFIPKATPAAAKAADDTKPADDKAAKPADDKKPEDKKVADKKADDKKPDAKKADDKKPDAKTAAGDAPKPFGLPTDVAKTKLEAVRAEIAAGKLTFMDAEKRLAADSSEDAPASNGDKGWRSVENPDLGEKPVNDAAKALKAGEMTPVIVGERGVYLVIATDKREGDLSFDQVKSEIASAMAKEVWSKEAAKRAALDTLAKVQSSAKPLEQQFERELIPNDNLEEILNNPNMTPEQKQQILEMLQRNRRGSLELHEQDVPVAWTEDPPGSGSSAAPAAPATGSAPAAGTAPATGTAPAAGTAPATGTPPAAGTAPATGTPPAPGSAAPAAGSAAPAAETPAPAPTVIEASKDVLPPLADMPKPKVNRLGPAPRQSKMPGIGGSKEAIDSLFDELAPGTLANRVYEGEAGSYVVVQLVNRAQPNPDEFDKIADVEIARMQEARGKAALRDWLKNRCDVLTKAGKIKAAPDRLRETDEKGNPAPTIYHPCMFFDFLDR